MKKNIFLILAAICFFLGGIAAEVKIGSLAPSWISLGLMFWTLSALME
jgi:hypothetical protein